MSLRYAIKAGLRTAFRAVGNSKEIISYMVRGPSAYDEDTMGIGYPLLVQYNQIPTIPVAFSSEEIDGDTIRPKDTKLLIQSFRLPKRPEQNDAVIRPDGTTWEVMGLVSDLTDAGYLVHIRGT